MTTTQASKPTAAKTCPLCGAGNLRPSWMGPAVYHGQEFRFAECPACGSLSCDPMPDAETLARMYGPEYETAFEFDPAVDNPKQPNRTLEWLRKLGGGTFLDYGCGTGSLLAEALKLKWEAIGLEFDPKVAEIVTQRTGAWVASDPQQLLAGGKPPADVLHLGDVVEHLTDLDRQLPEILQLIKPGGVLLSQGPLEAGPTLFTSAIRLGQSLRPARRTEMAPYHVLLATVAGQRALFQRFGLEELEYSVHEVSWPAPSRLTPSVLRRPRALALYAVRRLSQAVSALQRNRWGNRYFYAGRLPG